MNAKQTNEACIQFFDRLKANGKTWKQALIAVMNKLLKQVFAVVKKILFINLSNVQLYIKKVVFYFFYAQFIFALALFLNQLDLQNVVL